MQAHVLLVDDEEGPREALKFALERKNKWWKITTATGVDEARAILDAPSKFGVIDVVLTDLVMGRDHPEGGIEVLEIAKKKDPFIMVILFTAHDKMIDSEEAYKEGAFDCIEKNILGTVAARAISTKANAAIHFRNMLLSRLRHREQFLRLRRFFDPKIVRSIVNSPKFLDLKQRPATILLWDLSGFSELYTALAARPDQIQEFLGEYYKAATSVIFKHNGILDKFVGPRVMALFCGFGPAGGDFTARGAANAADAALMLRQASVDFLERWQKRWISLTGHEIPVGLGCVLHTGRGLIGDLGIEIHSQFTAIGPDVDLALALNQRSSPGRILITEAATTRLNQNYDIAVFDDVPGEGKIFELKSTRSRAAE